MVIDEYRLKKGKKDKAPVCYDDCMIHPHRKDSKQCKHYEDHAIARSLAGTMPVCNDEEAPF